ncbi:MAG: DNA modification methylase [Bacteroidales bacterium]|jgi:DNA modification methylase|nr:DNA modification methylase [Bacteroidales bacterium]
MGKTMQIVYFKTEYLTEYARNPRKNQEVIDKMVACIKEFGFRIPIIAKNDGSVVDGHLRLKAARKLGMTEVPVVIADDLSEAQIKAFRLVANQSANWASWDEELLKLEFEDLKNLNFDLEMTGFDMKEMDDFLHDSDEAKEEFDEPVSEEAFVVTKPGDLWILGNHRLLCGDAAKEEDFRKLLSNEKAEMVFTDPPYNVDYGTNQRDMIRGNTRTIKNDNIENFSEFIASVCENIINCSNGAIYIFMSAFEFDTLKLAFEKNGGHVSTIIVWSKNHFAVGKSDYQRQHEMILYGWKDKRYWCGDRTQSDIWSFDRVDANKLHPTMKPVELVKQAVSNSSKIGDIVLDPFCGSGTTIIACEKTSRCAYCIELEPKYVDVAIRRWQKLTKQNAILEATGKTFEEVASCH